MRLFLSSSNPQMTRKGQTALEYLLIVVVAIIVVVAVMFFMQSTSQEAKTSATEGLGSITEELEGATTTIGGNGTGDEDGGTGPGGTGTGDEDGNAGNGGNGTGTWDGGTGNGAGGNYTGNCTGNATCPPGMVWNPNNCSCVPAPQTCAYNIDLLDCPINDCPPETHYCMPNFEGTACECARPCGDTYPTCNGSCGSGVAGGICTATRAGCECKPLDYKPACLDTYPACNGTCWPGFECASNGTECLCYSSCSLSFPACNGTCEPNYECASNGTACSCEPPRVLDSYDMRAVVITYIPRLASDPELVDWMVTGWNPDDRRPWRAVEGMQAHVDSLNALIVEALTQGSTYHGYKESDAVPYLRYNIYRDKTLYKDVPRVLAGEYYYVDGAAVFEEAGVDICDLVENRGVKEVWFWHYGSACSAEHCAPTFESSQIGPKESFANGGIALDSWPKCAKSYVVYGYNYYRQLGEALENHGHHIEIVLKRMDRSFFDGYFVGSFAPGVAFRRCGWMHSTPNGAGDGYDWFEDTPYLSDCEDWKPDGSGQKKLVNCETWRDVFVWPGRDESKACPEDCGVAFKVWWMESLPGFDNGLAYNGKPLRNWWEFIGDYDVAVANGRSLFG